MSDTTPPVLSDVSSLFSPDQRASVALSALARAQDRAATEGKMRMSWKRRQHRFTSGSSEETAVVAQENEAELNSDLPAELQAFEAHTREAGSAWVSTPGLASARTRYRRSDSLGAVLSSLIRKQGWDHSTKLGSVMAKWSEIVGEQVSQHCVVESFDDQRLIVRCDSTAWTKQLQLLLPHIERRIDEEVGAGVVQQTIVRGPSVPSWKKGKLSVPGRGPRDTYG